MAQTEAQKEAQRKYDEANKERRNHLRSRSAARSFIRTKASYGELEELKNMIIKKQTEMENKYMYKLTAVEEGKEQSGEYFDTFEELKQHLIKTDYFSWIQDNEPERELPDFTEVETLAEVEAILEDFNYSWWKMEVEANKEEAEMSKMKDEKLKLENLMLTHLNEDGTNDLEFQFDDKKIFVRSAKVYSDAELDSTEYEEYWEKEENVKRAVEEAESEGIEEG